jgi:hypothetical protein
MSAFGSFTTELGNIAGGPVRAKPRHPSRDREGSTNQSTLPLNFERVENLAQKSAGMEIPAELMSKPSALFQRSLSSQRHHVILRAGGTAYADGTDHLAVGH